MLKIPKLVAHFYEHYQENPGLTLKDFLAMHYSDGMIIDDDWQEDMQLPFKTCEASHSMVPATGFPDPIGIPLPKLIIIQNFTTPKLPYLISSSPVEKIFQPPKWV